MQPNNEQGFYQPGQDPSGQIPAQPVQPVQPLQPVQPVQPLQPVAPVAPVAPVVAPLDPAQQQTGPVAPPVQQPSDQQDPSQVDPSQQPLDDGEYAEDDVDYDEADELSDEPVSWSAQEFIHREKGATWFILFTVVIAALVGISIWTQAWTFTALIVVIAILVIVYSRRPPRELTYTLNDDGLDIDGKMHAFKDFKSFGIIHDGLEYSVMLIPTQRFQPGISVYFPEEAGEDIVDMLGSRLPMRDLKLDAVDRLVRLLRL